VKQGDSIIKLNMGGPGEDSHSRISQSDATEGQHKIIIPAAERPQSQEDYTFKINIPMGGVENVPAEKGKKKKSKKKK